MNKETQIKEIELVLETLKSTGWQSVHKEFVSTLNALIAGAPSDCDTNDKWQERRGEIKMLNYFLSLEQVYQNLLEKLEDGGDEEEVNPLEIS